MHVIIFMWGFTGILGKLIHLDAIIIVWYRVIIAAMFLSFYFIFISINTPIILRQSMESIV